ncbi:MAG: carboxypeptidase regulatory-like domain-containing protein, partial [Terriglobia bacterium]
TCADGFFNGNALQLSDDVDLMRGRNHISFGANWIFNQFDYNDLFQGNGDPSFNGEFTGSGLADFLLGLTSSFTQGATQQLYLRKNYIGTYVQDDVRLNSRFNFDAGLRWEPFLPIYNAKPWQTYFSLADFNAGMVSKQFVDAPAGLLFAGDGIKNYYNASYADFEPRVGFVWDPKGNGRQTIRASYSIFYDTPETFYVDRSTNQPPWANNISLTSPAGGFTDPFLDYPGGNPFPLPSPPTSTFVFPPEGIYVNFPQNLHPTYMQQWDLSWQRQFANNWMVSATYIGNRTIHLWGGTEQDPAVFLTAAQCAAAGISASTCQSTKSTNQRRVFALQNPVQGPKIATMALTWDGASASYNGVILSTQHRFSKNYTLLFNYTYSHCLSDTDFTGELTGPSVQDPYDPNADYGNCGFDLRHNLVASLVATSPKFSNVWANRLLSNWQLSPIISYRSGLWFNPTTGTDRSLTGINNDRPDLVSQPYVTNTSTRLWLNPSAYIPNTLGTFGNVGRDSVVGPSYFDIDADLSRFFRIRENQRLELRFEFFNLGNNVNFHNPTSSLKSSNFGKILGANDPRILQFALKYYF